ncbi:MAG: DUF2752 domain-containing protein [Candidatus Nanopelagicales bacterium]|jgi:hypothetical protein
MSQPKPPTRNGKLLGIAGLVASGVLLFSIDPTLGVYPPCPSQLLFGLDCPLCGGLRGTYSLLHGDFGGLVDHNALLAVLYPLGVMWALLDMVKRLSFMRNFEIPDKHRSALLIALAVILVVTMVIFTIIRNVTPYWGSGLG